MELINTQDKRFKNGNGRDELGTVVTAEWLNSVQDELSGIIKGFGGTPNKATPNQVYLAIASALNSKLDNNGVQTLSGNLIIDKPTQWEKIRFATKSGWWRFEVNPEGDNSEDQTPVSYTHLTLPTNREV